MTVTAAVLYDLVQCPQRVALDAFGSAADRDAVNPFVRLLWERGTLFEARAILARELVPPPGYASVCKLCHWHTHCIAQLTAEDDLTLIPFLSRSHRDVMPDSIPTIGAFSTINPDGFIKGKKTVFPGMGADRLRQLQARAVMLKGLPPKPYLREPVTLDVVPIEL